MIEQHLYHLAVTQSRSDMQGARIPMRCIGLVDLAYVSFGQQPTRQIDMSQHRAAMQYQWRECSITSCE